MTALFQDGQLRLRLSLRPKGSLLARIPHKKTAVTLDNNLL